MTARTTSVVELAEDWLAAKRVGARRDDPGNSDRARRADLARWGRAIGTVQGRDVADTDTLEVTADLAAVQLADLHPDVLLRALDVVRTTYEVTSAQRMLSTLRGFCAWLTRRGHLDTNPTDDDLLRVSTAGRGGLVKAFTAEEVEAMIRHAEHPDEAVRTAWPARDAAVIALLAGTGLRASELCALEIRSIDRTLERPVLRITRGSKGGKVREIPVPRPVLARVDAWLASRTAAAEAEPELRPASAAPLFARHDGRAFNQQFLDRLIRRVAEAAAVDMPGDAAAHALRHHYGVQLALRGVPLPVIQQLMGHADPRTTTIYTRMAARNLTDALDDAGWL